jgi:hypothetical protein
MICCRNLKLGQSRKLFIIFKLSIMQSLHIFGNWEGFWFEFQSLGEYEIKEKFKLGRAHLSATLRLLTCARRPSDGTTSLSQLQPPAMAPLLLDHADQRCPTWAWPYPRVCDVVENFSSPFTPSRPHSLTCCLLYHLHSRLLTITTTNYHSPSSSEPGICTPLSATPTTAGFQPDPLASSSVSHCHRLPSSIDLRTCNNPEEHHKITPSLLDQSFIIGDHLSVPPSTTTPPPTSLPPLARLGEPLSV